MRTRFRTGRQSRPILRLAPLAIERPRTPTANHRFKRSFGPAFRIGLTLAVGLHVAAFGIFPRFGVTDLAVAGETMSAVQLPPSVEIPPPPQAIARPATPRVATVEVSERLTIAPTTFEGNPVERLGPPPSDAGEADDRPPFIPYTVAPKLENRDEVLLLLQRTYPPPLKSAGIGGTVILWVHVDERGEVTEARVAGSSGYRALDEAAQKVARGMRYTPAMNRDRVTAVWLSQPITFDVL